MVGAFRFFLAAAVVAFHLTNKLSLLGPFAVLCFYVISGFLITMVLTETYKFNGPGFVANRFLRLYPAYAAMALVALALHFGTPWSKDFHPSWAGPSLPGDTFANVFIFPWAFLSDPLVQVDFWSGGNLTVGPPHFRLVPSTWSVGIEVVCYFLLWAFVARSTWTAIIGISIGLLWQVYLKYKGLDYGLRYFPIPAALLPFSLGSIAYRISKVNPLSEQTRSSFRFQLLTGVCLLNFFLLIWLLAEIRLYLAFFIVELMVAAALCIVGSTKPRGNLGDIDRWLGDLSYPIFLGHYLFAYVAWITMGRPTEVRGWPIFAAGFSLTVLAGVAVIVFIDKPISRLRSLVRERTRRLGSS